MFYAKDTMHTFNYSFLKDIRLSPAFAGRIARIEGFRSNVSRFISENPDTAKDMKNVAKAMSVRESNAIEGIHTVDTRIFGLLSGQVEPQGHDEYELLGYRDALDHVHRNHDSLEISESTILEIFRMLVSYTGNPPTYKKVNNAVVDKDQYGNITKVYPTVPADQVENCMFQLVYSFIDARADMGISNLMLIPCFIFDFLKIHPFLDGNGRMSRLLTNLLLYQEGFDICAYVSIESIINQTKDDYYTALERSGEGWFDNESDYMPFIEYMIWVLFLAFREFDRRAALCIGKDDKANRVERLLSNVTLPISKKEICAFMPDVSETYVELVVGKMVKDGRVKRIGPRNSSRYIPARE